MSFLALLISICVRHTIMMGEDSRIHDVVVVMSIIVAISMLAVSLRDFPDSLAETRGIACMQAAMPRSHGLVCGAAALEQAFASS